jgi:hypothetical protein
MLRDRAGKAPALAMITLFFCSIIPNAITLDVVPGCQGNLLSEGFADIMQRTRKVEIEERPASNHGDNSL